MGAGGHQASGRWVGLAPGEQGRGGFTGKCQPWPGFGAGNGVWRLSQERALSVVGFMGGQEGGMGGCEAGIFLQSRTEGEEMSTFPLRTHCFFVPTLGSMAGTHSTVLSRAASAWSVLGV